MLTDYTEALRARREAVVNAHSQVPLQTAPALSVDRVWLSLCLGDFVLSSSRVGTPAAHTRRRQRGVMPNLMYR